MNTENKAIEYVSEKTGTSPHLWEVIESDSAHVSLKSTVGKEAEVTLNQNEAIKDCIIYSDTKHKPCVRI